MSESAHLPAPKTATLSLDSSYGQPRRFRLISNGQLLLSFPFAFYQFSSSCGGNTWESSSTWITALHPTPNRKKSTLSWTQFYREFGVNPGRSGFDFCMETGDLIEDTRKMLTEFFNGTDPDRLCFCYNSTDALNHHHFGMLEKGDHAISTTIEHNSVLRPLYHQSEFNGVEVDWVHFDDKGFVDPDDIKQKVQGQHQDSSSSITLRTSSVPSNPSKKSAPTARKEASPSRSTFPIGGKDPHRYG